MAFDFLQFDKGFRIVPQDGTTLYPVQVPTLSGEIRYDASANKFQVFATTTDYLVTENDTATITNKTLDGDDNTFLNLPGDQFPPGSIPYASLDLSNSIVDSDINTNASITISKLASLTINRAVITNGSGKLSISPTTATELGFVSGVTSSIQTQINTLSGSISGFATKALDNLASTAVNVDINPGSDNTISLGSALLHYSNLHTKAITSSDSLKYVSPLFQYSSNGSNFYNQAYFDSITLASGISSPTEVSSSLSFAFATYKSVSIEYSLKEAVTGHQRTGNILIATDGTAVSLTDSFTDTASLGNDVLFSAQIVGSNVEIDFSGTSTNTCTLRCFTKYFRS